VRERIGLGLGDAPVWSGRTAWRATLRAADAPAFARRLETGLWLGPHAHLVHYPLREGTLINVVAITEDPWRAEGVADLWSVAGRREGIVPGFARWHREARDLVEAVTEWRRWPLFDRNPVRRWSLDRVVLVGDAAHPMLPFFAQGAAQAIEDAAALGRAFARDGGDVPAALKAYETTRTKRAGAVVLASRRQGAIYHLRGPVALARDLVMHRLGAHGMMSRLDWLYNYTPPA
jgi:salicylate hydroxylase